MKQLSSAILVIWIVGCGPGPTLDQRKENLTKIGKAIDAYEGAHKHFPRADGHEDPDPPKSSRGLSWRVHLLPFLGHQALYQKFDFDEPWDGPANSKLIAEMPDVFRSAGATNPGETCFHVLLGPRREGAFTFVDPSLVQPTADVPAWGRNISAVISDFTDGTSNTILVVEAGVTTVTPWTKPGGLLVDPKNPKAVIAKKEDGLLLLMCDGMVRNISQSKVSDKLLLAMMTRAGNEDLTTMK